MAWWVWLSCAPEAPPIPGGEDPPLDRFADLAFAPVCRPGAVEAAVTLGGWSAEVPLACDGVEPAEVERARAAAEADCASVADASACAALGDSVAAELERLASRRRTVAVTFFPLEPEGLSTDGSAAEMEIAYEDGTSERWTNGTRPWGERYVRIEADGAIEAQGSVTSEPPAASGLRCSAVRDHTMTGRIGGPSDVALSFREGSDLTCDAGAALAFVVTQAFVEAP